jgi:signal transduction histidine kinase/PAS domain-containing protein
LQKSGKVENMEARFRMKDGRVVTGLMSASVIMLHGEAHILSVTRNIEHLKQLEREREQLLQETERARKLLDDVFSRITDGVVALDTNWRYTYLNEQAAKMLNREKPEDLLGKHIWTEYPEGVGQPFHQAYERAMETQQPIVLEDYYEPWDRWFENRIFPSPEGLTIFFTEITERKRAEEVIHRTNRRLEALHRLDSAILQARSVEEIIQAALEHLAQSVPADRISIAILDEKKGEAMVYAHGVLEKEIGCGRTVPLEGLFYDLPGLRRGEPTFIENFEKIEQSNGILAQLAKEGIRSVVNIPMMADDILLGSLNLAGKQADVLDEEAVQIGREVAATIAIAIRQARLTQQIRRRLDELEAIYQAAQALQQVLTPEQLAQKIIATLEKLLDYEYGAVLLIDEPSGRLLPFALSDRGRGPEFLEADKANVTSRSSRLGEGIPGWVAQTGRSVRVGDVRQDRRYVAIRENVRSELCVPLRLGDQVIGVVDVESKQINAFSKNDQRILETVASQVAIAIQNSRLLEQVQRHARELELRVAQRTAELQAANQTLKEFVYSVSHDLRAPLRAISGFAGIIADRYRESLNEEARRYFDYILEAAHNMNRLISDLLAYSRLGKDGITPQPVSLSELLNEILSELKSAGSTAEADIRIAPDLPTVLGIPTLLRQVFANLLDNALKYRRPGVKHRVEVRGRTEGDCAVIEVVDNGIGIAPEYQEKIFQIFQRLHSQADYPGTGVGLAIVKKALDLMEGTVEVESQSGEGSVFRVKLKVGGKS